MVVGAADYEVVAEDGESFTAFFAREYTKVIRLGVALTGDRCAAEDLAQDAFLAARERWGSLRSYEDPGAWVRRVVSNRSVSRWRRLVVEARTATRLTQKLLVVLPDESAEVWDAVRRLPRRQAQVFVLAVVEDLPAEEIAVILRCGPETVRTHLRRARERLASMLGEGQEDSR